MSNSNALDKIKIINQWDNYFDIKNRSKYINEFNRLREKGFFDCECNFNDNYWVHIVGGKELSANFPSDMVLKKVIKVLDLRLSIEQLMIAYKAFVLKNREDRKYFYLAINSINKIKNGINKLANIEPRDLSVITDFIKYIGVSKEISLEIEEISNLLLSQENNCKDDNTRTLPAFNDVFKFINIIDDILENKEIENYLEYIPVILWWKITSIIPIRPSEFINIRFDSIKNENNTNYLYVKRSKAKSGKKISNISQRDEYYYEEKIAINQETLLFINRFKEIIRDKFNYTENEFLIPYVLREHNPYRKLNKKIFTSDDLARLLNNFYINVVEKEYGFKSISRYEKSDSDKCIQRLIPYDARHIAIINLVLLGTEPQTVMKLAGHTNIQTTEGYYNHVLEFADCFSISVAKKIKYERKIDYNHDSKVVKGIGSEVFDVVMYRDNEPIKVDGGYCCYKKINEDKSICIALKVNCNSCTYFRPTDIQKLRDTEMKIYKELSSEAKTLRDMVEYKNIYKYDTKIFVNANRVRGKANELAVVRANLMDIEDEQNEVNYDK